MGRGGMGEAMKRDDENRNIISALREKSTLPETREDTMSEIDFVSGLFLAPNMHDFMKDKHDDED